MTIADQILSINSSKQAIKDAIEASGVTVGGVPFADYAAKVEEISVGTWVRPSDWLALPALTDADSEFVGLHAIEPDSCFCALSATGAYTVDWGDGTVQNIASGVTAQHQYDYATYDLAGATLCSRGYKQAIVTITPQAGQTLTSINLNLRHSALTVAYSSGFLDIAIAGASITSLTLGGTLPVRHAQLEQAKLYANAITTFFTAFSSCSSLRSIPALNTAAGTNFTSMFSNCSSLRSIPVLNTAAGTNFTSMFNNCTSLQTITALNTAAGTNFTSMFSNCTSLQTITALNTAAGTNFSSMFNSCPSLQTVPVLNTAVGTNFTSMFNSCTSLREVPALSLSAATSSSSYTNMFASSSSISDINATGAKFNFSVANCKLSAARLNELFGNLATVSGQTITVTGNYGAATCDTSIAIAKGWSATV